MIAQAFSRFEQMDGLVVLLIIIVIIVIIIIAWAAWNQSNQNQSKNAIINGVVHNLNLLERSWQDATYWTRMLIVEKLNKSGGVSIIRQRLTGIRNNIGKGYGILIGQEQGKLIAESLIERDNRLCLAIDSLEKGRLVSLDNHDLNQSTIDALSVVLSTGLNSSDINSHLNGLDNSFKQQVSLLKQGDWEGALSEFDVAVEHTYAISASIGRTINNTAILLTRNKA